MHTTAAELWRTWIQTKVVQPRSHDSDLAQTLCSRLGIEKVSGISRAMDAAGWLPRDLLHAIADDLQSFSGMLQDLLLLYERIGARTATGENLRISYEFVDGEPFDILLSSFREQVADVRAAVRELVTPLSFGPDFAFKSPISDMVDSARIGELFGPGDLHTISLPRTAPRPPPTGTPHSDAVIERGLRVVDAVFAMLATGGPTIGDAIGRLGRPGQLNEADVEQAIVDAATDLWPFSTTAALHGLADVVREGRGHLSLIEDVEVWLDNFQSADPIEVTVERLIDVLSMPTWGMRHELYAAWIATQFDRALPPDRLTFAVAKQTLRFPFKATHVATVHAADAVHELWSEIRSDLLDASGKRVRGIQPDYRVLRRNRDGSSATVLAVEVKQYRRSDAKKHGKVLEMYAAGLPDANVFLVGHGPIGAARAHVPPTYHDRTKVFEHVRPGRNEDAAAFRAALAELLPPPLLPERVELTWDERIHDLDLHLKIDGETINWQKLSGEGGTLRADAFNGGPEVIDLATEVNASIDVEVRLYSSEVSSVLTAKPLVKIFWVGGEVTDLHPPKDLPPGEERRWVVCRIDGGMVTPFGETADGPDSRAPTDP